MKNVPLYVQYANELRKDILAGRYGSEGGLPGIEELVRRSGLTHNTIYRSLSLLMKERLIQRRDKAYYVMILPTMTMTKYVGPLHIRMQMQGRVSFSRNIEDVERLPLPDEIADRASVSRGTMAVHRLRLLGEVLDGKEVPSRLVEYWYILELSDAHIQKMRDDPKLHILLEVGPVDLLASDRVSARMPTVAEAALFNVAETTPVLSVEIMTRSADDGCAILAQNIVLLPSGSVSHEYAFKNR